MSMLRTMALAVAIAAAPIASSAWADDHGLEQVLAATASTPAQHKALADYYRGKAADAKAEAESHRTMAKDYAAGTSVPLGRQRAEHCKKIASLADSRAAEYEKLAASHDSQAK
jgi:uncharacterized protein YcaQ